jgi:hypothetical protein
MEKMSDFVIPQKHIPQINRGDTFQFTRNFGTVAVNSVFGTVIDPSGTAVSSVSATQSGTSSNWNLFITTPTSWYSTVKTTALWQLQWTAYRSTGNEKEIQYYETISYVLDDI